MHGLWIKLASWFNADSSFLAVCFILFVILFCVTFEVEFIILIQ